MVIARVIKSANDKDNLKTQGDIPINGQPRYKELEPAPKEIQALMSTINEILARGEDVPDSLVKEFEVQMEVSGDFNVIELMKSFDLASQFYGIRGVLETKKRSNRKYLIKKFEDDLKHDPETPHPIVEEAPIPNIPQQSDDELMESMRDRDYGDIHADEEYIVNQPVSISEAEVAVQQVKNTEKTNIQENSTDNSSNIAIGAATLAVQQAMQNEAPVEQPSNITKEDSFFPEASLSKDKQAVESAASQVQPSANQTYQPATQDIFKPLLSSFMTPFASMLSSDPKNKPAKTHLSKESFQSINTDNRIEDFKTACVNHGKTINGIVSLGKKYHESGDAKDKASLVSEIDKFINKSKFINKEFNRLENNVDMSSNQSKLFNSISKEHADNIEATKEDVKKYFGGNIPLSLVKLFDRAFESIKKFVSNVFKSTSIQESKHAPVEPISD